MNRTICPACQPHDVIGPDTTGLIDCENCGIWLNAYQSQWLEHHGKTVKLNGHVHFLKVDTYEAIYPYAHTVLRVHAVPVSTKTRYYKAIREQLGDDWSTDVLASEEVTVSIMQQIGWRGEQ
jgi:hypothetical protein